MKCSIVKDLINSCKKYSTPEEIDSLLKNEPKQRKRDISNDQRTYYWKKLSREALKRKAYQDGIDYQRKACDSIKNKRIK